MFEVTTCEVCATCQTVTPHSTRRVAVPRVVAGLLFAAGVAAALASRYGAEQWILPAPLAFGLALGVWLRDRRQYWRITCERCRSKRIAAEQPERAVWFNGRNIIDL